MSNTTRTCNSYKTGDEKAVFSQAVELGRQNELVLVTGLALTVKPVKKTALVTRVGGLHLEYHKLPEMTICCCARAAGINSVLSNHDTHDRDIESQG